jgi:predicted nuclease of predicted toxin-antitoxin system
LKFKVDENLPKEVAQPLQSAGHNATTVPEEGMLGADDPVIARRLLEERRGIITLDKHFADIRNYPPEVYDGIIVLRTKFPDKPTVLSMLRRILHLINPDDLVGDLWIVEANTIRKRKRLRIPEEGRDIWPPGSGSNPVAT